MSDKHRYENAGFPMTTAISPGISWYETSVGKRPDFPALNMNVSCDVAIIGGGYTGLCCALHLAHAGVNTILIDGAHFGNGASGRNGGQLGTGQRRWVEELEKIYGFTRTKALFDLSERAKASLITFASIHDIEFQKGQLSVAHKDRYVDLYRQHQETMAHYGYHQLAFLNAHETTERLGSKRYYGGLLDEGTGHIHPLKLVLALAAQAAKAGAQLHENTVAQKLSRTAKGFIIETTGGTIKAERVVLATNAYGPILHEAVKAHIIPIRSYIGATEPLPPQSPILPGGEAVDDSRFVVRYFKKSADNRLLFGGAESYSSLIPGNMTKRVRAQIQEVYPELQSTPLTHVWGGTVAITVERMPYIRELEPGLFYSGGYSGHGVMLAPYMGRLIADHLTNQGEDWNIMNELKISSFPGGKFLRRGLLFFGLNWFALKDRF